MNAPRYSFATAAFLALVMAAPLPAQEVQNASVDIRQVTTHMGEMKMTIEVENREVDDSIVFEPFQALADIVQRDDVVYLMRHGPTDWSKLDDKNVAPTDCENQRIMSEQGREDMRNLGSLLGAAGRVPAKIVVSQWCRNQQTIESLLQGYADVDAEVADAIPVETDASLNLLLSLQGAPNTTRLRELITTWDGDPARKGPLLIISHYTNIEELTQFQVFEGEILVLDPKRNNRVLGYLRLSSASPDVGHFADVLASPLQDEERALSMIERYYTGLNNRDFSVVDGILSEEWLTRSAPDGGPTRNAEMFFEDIQAYLAGIPDSQFNIDSLHFSDDVVTVIGTVSGTHTGTLFGVAPTGREVSFGAIAVHRVDGNQIVETWQIPDRQALMRQVRR